MPLCWCTNRSCWWCIVFKEMLLISSCVLHYSVLVGHCLLLFSHTSLFTDSGYCTELDIMFDSSLYCL